MNRMNRPGFCTRHAVCTTLAMALVAGTNCRLAAQPPPKNVKEIKRLEGEIDKLRGREGAEIAKVLARYGDEVAKLNLFGLSAEIERLRRERQDKLWKAVDRARWKAIEAKHKPQILALQKQIKAREAQIAQLEKQWATELEKVRTLRQQDRQARPAGGPAGDAPGEPAGPRDGGDLQAPRFHQGRGNQGWFRAADQRAQAEDRSHPRTDAQPERAEKTRDRRH